MFKSPTDNMNRQAVGQPRQTTVPSGYRSASGAPSSAPGSNGMFFGGVGGPQAPGRSGLLGQGQSLGGFPSSGSIGRGGPPGFGGRTSDPNDFPALGSLGSGHNQHASANSTYASQTQTSHGGSNTAQIQQQLQFLHLQGQQHQQMDSGMAPPPPPGLAPSSSSNQPNGAPGDGMRDDFPALGDKDSRMAGLMKMGGAPGSAPGGSPQASLNGPSTAQSTSATPSTNPPHMTSAGGPPSDSWARQSPSRPAEPLVRPVQQIMSSPVDKWGLKALLYEIRTQMGKGDRSMLLFGEDLTELGMDINNHDNLYSSFVTPWADPGSLQHPPQIEDMFVIPSCYNVVPPPVETKLPNFSEETLFYIFYSMPQDVVQLMAAEELYNRGWRFSTDLRVWLTSGPLSQIDLHADSSLHPSTVRGPFTVFNPGTFSREPWQGSDFTIDVSTLEATRPAASLAGDKAMARKDAARSPSNGNNGPGAVGSMPSNAQYQNMQAAH